MTHGDHREWARVALRPSAAERIADSGRGNKGISWGSSLITGLAQSWEKVSPLASSCPCMASCMPGIDDNQAGSGLGGTAQLHGCAR